MPSGTSSVPMSTNAASVRCCCRGGWSVSSSSCAARFIFLASPGARSPSRAGCVHEELSRRSVSKASGQIPTGRDGGKVVPFYMYKAKGLPYGILYSRVGPTKRWARSTHHILYACSLLGVGLPRGTLHLCEERELLQSLQLGLPLPLLSLLQ